jgi:hypothetical protein
MLMTLDSTVLLLQLYSTTALAHVQNDMCTRVLSVGLLERKRGGDINKWPQQAGGSMLLGYETLYNYCVNFLFQNNFRLTEKLQ